MKAKVQFYGPVRVITNKSEEEIEISSEITVYGLLQHLSIIYGTPFEKEVFLEDKRNLRGDTVISINGNLVNHSNISETNIKPNDIITIFPLFPGGG